MRFCTGAKVASFDGTLLDVDVTLPATGDGPFPALAMLHGYGGDKTSWERDNAESRDAEGRINSQTYHWNNVHFAQRGYVVINYTARGFGESDDHVHLKDQRVEAHDTQHLLGRLVDEGIARPDALGVTGVSYGGGESIQLAYLRDRVRNADDSFSPWVSPEKKVPLKIAAAYPRWPWSDLVSALLPERALPRLRPGDQRRRRDAGRRDEAVLHRRAVRARADDRDLRAAAHRPARRPHDLGRARQRRRALRRPGGGVVRRRAAPVPLGLRARRHRGAGADAAARSAGPTTCSRRWRRCASTTPPARPTRSRRVALQIGDLGHQRGGNKLAADQYLNDQGTAFLDAHLKGKGAPPAPGAVTAFTQTCPVGAPAGGPFTAHELARAAPDRRPLRQGGGADRELAPAATRRRAPRSTPSRPARTRAGRSRRRTPPGRRW